jgi:hypothetical protein
LKPPLINNAHYYVQVHYSINAVGGSNHRGDVVTIQQKRTRKEMTIPLPVFEKIWSAVAYREKK